MNVFIVFDESRSFNVIYKEVSSLNGITYYPQNTIDFSFSIIDYSSKVLSNASILGSDTNSIGSISTSFGLNRSSSSSIYI